MRKQLFSFAQVIKFFEISSSRGFLTPPPLRTPLQIVVLKNVHVIFWDFAAPPAVIPCDCASLVKPLIP